MNFVNCPDIHKREEIEAARRAKGLDEKHPLNTAAASVQAQDTKDRKGKGKGKGDQNKTFHELKLSVMNERFP